MASLQTVCDKWLNEPTGNALTYQPILPMVMITFSHNGMSGPTSEPYSDWGTVGYQEVIFSLFVARVNKEGNVWIVEHVSALVPYIFVSDAIVMAAGREVYGIPKTLGWVDMPKSTTENTLSFSLQSIGTPQFRKGQPFSKNVITTIKDINLSSPSLSTDWKELDEALASIKKLIFGEGHLELPGLKLLIEIADLFLEKELPFTSLRQVRSLSSPNEAVYKDVINFAAKAKAFKGGGKLKGTYQLSMPEQQLLPIAQDLGLKDGQQAEAAFWVNWDFIFETGKQIWSTNEKKTLLQRMEDLI
jgi:hypothetical protein